MAGEPVAGEPEAGELGGGSPPLLHLLPIYQPTNIQVYLACAASFCYVRERVSDVFTVLVSSGNC